MLLETSEDQIPIHNHIDTIHFCDSYVVNQTIRVLGKGLPSDTDLLSMTLFNLVQEFIVPTNGNSIYRLQLRDTRQGFIQLGR